MFLTTFANVANVPFGLWHPCHDLPLAQKARIHRYRYLYKMHGLLFGPLPRWAARLGLWGGVCPRLSVCDPASRGPQPLMYLNVIASNLNVFECNFNVFSPPPLLTVVARRSRTGPCPPDDAAHAAFFQNAPGAKMRQNAPKCAGRTLRLRRPLKAHLRGRQGGGPTAAQAPCSAAYSQNPPPYP